METISPRGREVLIAPVPELSLDLVKGNSTFLFMKRRLLNSDGQNSLLQLHGSPKTTRRQDVQRIDE